MPLPATTKSGGDCVGAPNVCKVPGPVGPIPVPMGSKGSPSTASDTIKTVMIKNKELCVESSKVKSSGLDDPGTLKGVMSSTQGDVIQFKRHSSKVYAANKKMVHHTALTAHNGSNANLPVGNHVSPSQTKVLIG